MKEKYLIPLSLIISATILGAGIYFTNLTNTSNDEKKDATITKEDLNLGIKPVDISKEYIQGSKEADIFVIEYSDLECIGCKVFSKIEKDLIEKYKDNPRVAFVFRHFPLYKSIGDSNPIHPTSGVEARATECAGKLGGEEKFFQMKDKIFETTKSNGNYPLENLSGLAEDLGINEKDFNTCINSEEIADKIENLWQEAYDAGINSTPSIFIQIKSAGRTFKAVPGKDIIDRALQSYIENN